MNRRSFLGAAMCLPVAGIGPNARAGMSDTSPQSIIYTEFARMNRRGALGLANNYPAGKINPIVAEAFRKHKAGLEKNIRTANKGAKA